MINFISTMRSVSVRFILTLKWRTASVNLGPKKGSAPPSAGEKQSDMFCRRERSESLYG